jgi:ubiquitin-associated SH3 domain-containing protein
MLELIVYACPTGELAAALDNYFRLAKANFGANPAHNYMPHITLTSFFQIPPEQLEDYKGYLTDALAAHQPTPTPILQIMGLVLRPEFHGFDVRAPHLKIIAADFATRAHTHAPDEPDINIKDWLHLSLAYDFPAKHDPGLRQLARFTVDPKIPASWSLRLYQRHERGWTQHVDLPL